MNRTAMNHSTEQVFKYMSMEMDRWKGVVTDNVNFNNIAEIIQRECPDELRHAGVNWYTLVVALLREVSR